MKIVEKIDIWIRKKRLKYIINSLKRYHHEDIEYHTFYHKNDYYTWKCKEKLEREL